MSRATLERAFELARSGEVADLAGLKRRLKSERLRSVEILLAPRNLSLYLDAVCVAASSTPLPNAARID